jgi:hypothetical protein
VPQRVHRPDGSWADIDLSLRKGRDGLLRPIVSTADVRFGQGQVRPGRHAGPDRLRHLAVALRRSLAHLPVLDVDQGDFPQRQVGDR